MRMFLAACSSRTNDNGELVGVPPGYRRFFLDEERRLLGL
jgi:hypothetical protein